MIQEIQEIELTKISPNKWNPRGSYMGTDFDELVDSIREKGIVQPILVRPLKKDTFEIVFGQRRFTATMQLAKENGGPEGFKIPCMVRKLSDDDVFDLMLIENLQRKDLNELEQAKGYKQFVDRHGEDALPDLSKRICKPLSLMRRRLMILTLPTNVLKAWSKGIVKIGHLDQLARLRNKKQILEYFKDIISYGTSARQIKEQIERKSCFLEAAKFDIEKAGCFDCPKNTVVEEELTGTESELESAHCLDPVCFKKKLNDWLQAHWTESDYRKSSHTNGFRFSGDIDWSEYKEIWTKPAKECKECPSLVTIIRDKGEIHTKRACGGDPSCHIKVYLKNQRQEGAESGVVAKKDSGRMPPAWHGEYFREKFYKEQIPLRLAEVSPDDEKIHRLSLISLLHSNREVGSWFSQIYIGKEKEKYMNYCYSSTDAMWQYIEKLSKEEVQAILKEASILVALQGYFGSKARHVIGTYLGLDLARDWRLNKEYLEKKTIKEMLAMDDKLGIFKDKAAQDFLFETLGKKRGKFTSCKKGELIRVFLESGVDLAGKVPKEILKID